METVIVSITVAILTYLAAPILNWNIDRRKQVYSQKILLVSQWRQMLAEVYKSYYENKPEITHVEFDVIGALKQNPSFYILKPHLSHRINKHIDSNTVGNISSLMSSGPHNVLIHIFSAEISRIEKEWGVLDERGLLPWWVPRSHALSSTTRSLSDDQR
jgi:hypothetical protein